MKRTCARSTCSTAAAATLSYSYADRIVWIEPLIEEPHPMVHDMCAEHASRVNPPRGWELRDLRFATESSNDSADAERNPLDGPGVVRFDLIGA